MPADPALVAVLTGMGYSEQAARRGLARTRGDLGRAVDWIAR